MKKQETKKAGLGLFIMEHPPYIRSENGTRVIFLDYLIAVFPVFIWACYVFGTRIAVITVISIGSAFISQLLFCLVTKVRYYRGMDQAILYGILLSLLMPVSIPLWIPAGASFFAVILMHGFFERILGFCLNPVLSAYVFFNVLFQEFFVYTKPFAKISAFSIQVENLDSVSSPAWEAAQGGILNYSLWDALLGNLPGRLGEVSIFLLVIGGIYLLCRRVITWHIPVSFLAVIFLLSFFWGTEKIIFGFSSFGTIAIDFALSQMVTGGVVLCAIFMATEYHTAPVTGRGKVLFGIGCGILTVVLNRLGKVDVAVISAILLMNLFVKPMDYLLGPKGLRR